MKVLSIQQMIHFVYNIWDLLTGIFILRFFTDFLLLPLLKYLHVCDLGHNYVLRFLAAGQTVTDQTSLLCVVFCPQRPQCFYTTMYPNNLKVILVCTSFVVQHSLIHCLKEMMSSKQSSNYPYSWQVFEFQIVLVTWSLLFSILSYCALIYCAS